MTYLHIFANFAMKPVGGISEPYWAIETFTNDKEDFAPDEDAEAVTAMEMYCPRILITQAGDLQALLCAEYPGESAYFRIPMPLERPVCFFEVHTDPIVLSDSQMRLS